MKLLSIGNSFSQDAHRYLHELAQYNGYDLETVNLIIPGCSLERHYDCMTNGQQEYILEINGCPGLKKMSLAEGLESERFDVITLQQASRYCGKPQTYFPYLERLVAFCREKQPEAKIVFHMTWAYEWDYPGKNFGYYGRNQDEMYRRLTDCCEMVQRVFGLPIIPVGTVIQTLRETAPGFDYRNGGLSLCRDGFHLALDYGRLTAACVWLRFLMNKPIRLEGFADLDPVRIGEILRAVEAAADQEAFG